jgi:hypothetical protein
MAKDYIEALLRISKQDKELFRTEINKFVTFVGADKVASYWASNKDFLQLDFRQRRYIYVPKTAAATAVPTAAAAAVPTAAAAAVPTAATAAVPTAATAAVPTAATAAVPTAAAAAVPTAAAAAAPTAAAAAATAPTAAATAVPTVAATAVPTAAATAPTAAATAAAAVPTAVPTAAAAVKIKPKLKIVPSSVCCVSAIACEKSIQISVVGPDTRAGVRADSGYNKGLPSDPWSAQKQKIKQKRETLRADTVLALGDSLDKGYDIGTGSLVRRAPSETECLMTAYDNGRVIKGQEPGGFCFILDKGKTLVYDVVEDKIAKITPEEAEALDDSIPNRYFFIDAVGCKRSYKFVYSVRLCSAFYQWLTTSHFG